jgi:predicted MFS family arabinose efflux permease
MIKPHRLVPLYLGGIMMLGLMGTYTIPFVIGAFIDGLGMNAQSAGALGTVEIFSIAVSALTLSRVLTPSNLRRISAVAIVLCIVAQALSSVTTSYHGLVILRLLAGVASGALLAVVNMVIATSRSPAPLYGWVFAIASLGFAIMLTFLPYSLAFNGQQGLFIAITFICLLISPLTWMLPKPSFADTGQAERQSSQDSSAFLIGLFFLALTIVYLMMGGVWSFSERVANNLLIEQDAIGLLLGLSTLTGVIGAISAGFLAKAERLTTPVALGFVVSGISAVVIAQSGDLAVYSIGILLYGYCYMFTVTFVLGIAAALDSAGRVAIATNAYLMIPYSLGPVVFGIAGLGNISILGWISLAGCVLAVLIIFPVSRRAERHSP